MTVIKQYTGGNWEAILVGEQGPVGPAGPGVPAGGATGDLLVKNSGTNYDTAWSDAPTVDSITLDTTAAETLAAVGQTAWDDTAGSAATLLKGGNVTAIMGQTIYQRVVNETGSPLTKGQVVYLTGASGQKVTVALAQADGDPTSSKTFGVVAETIAHSAQGFVMTEGLLQGFATNLLTEGALIWLSPTTAGGMTTTKPTAPDHTVMVGICVKSGSGTSGSILVKVQNGYELDELHDVAYTGTPATGDVLTRSASGLWTNAAPAASGAPVGAQYVTLATDGTLTSERVLTAGAGITVTDGGAGAAVTVASSALELPASAGFFQEMQPLTSGQYTVCGSRSQAEGTNGIPAVGQNVFFVPVVFRRTITIDQLGARVTQQQAGATFRLGVYSSTATGGINTLLFDSGNLDGSTQGLKMTAASLVFQAETLYWFAAARSNLTMYVRSPSLAALSPFRTIRTNAIDGLTNNYTHAYFSQAYGAMPTGPVTPTDYIAAAGATPYFTLRIA